VNSSRRPLFLLDWPFGVYFYWFTILLFVFPTGGEQCVFHSPELFCKLSVPSAPTHWSERKLSPYPKDRVLFFVCLAGVFHANRFVGNKIPCPDLLLDCLPAVTSVPRSTDPAFGGTVRPPTATGFSVEVPYTFPFFFFFTTPPLILGTPFSLK